MWDYGLAAINSGKGFIMKSNEITGSILLENKLREILPECLTEKEEILGSTPPEVLEFFGGLLVEKAQTRKQRGQARAFVCLASLKRENYKKAMSEFTQLGSELDLWKLTPSSEGALFHLMGWGEV